MPFPSFVSEPAKAIARSIGDSDSLIIHEIT
jgi:hypothetical protein